MEGSVTWPQLYLITGMTMATVGAVGWVVFRLCQAKEELEVRIAHLEFVVGVKPDKKEDD